MCNWPACARTDLKALGFCRMHYARVRRGITPPVPTERVRCESVDHVKARCTITSDGCWVFPTVDTHGYGRISVDRVQTTTHRYVYERLTGPVPAGLDLDHLCRVRACCNPDHLEPVTRSENLRRGAESRGPHPTCKWGHDMTNPDNVDTPSGGRRGRCKTCRQERQRRYEQTRSTAPQATT